jgi:hypothetical protein
MLLQLISVVKDLFDPMQQPNLGKGFIDEAWCADENFARVRL